MAVIYNKEVIVAAEPVTLEKWQRILYKFKFLIPLYPKKDETSGVRYWLGLGIVLGLSVWFYILGLYFIFQGVTDRGNLIFYLAIALVWLVAGLVLPSGIYRLIILILKKQQLID